MDKIFSDNPSSYNNDRSNTYLEVFSDQIAQAIMQDSQKREMSSLEKLNTDKLYEFTQSRKDTAFVIPFGAHADYKNIGVALTPIDQPDGSPKAHAQPAPSFLDGKCGITAVSNLLKYYDVDKAPAGLDQDRYRSFGPGLRAEKFAENMTKLSKKNFTAKTIEKDENPLSVLRDNLKNGKPMAINYMCDSTTAHWVVVTDVSETKNGPVLTVMSGGQYNQVPWKDIQNQWSRGYGGPYPYIVGDDASPFLQKKQQK